MARLIRDRYVVHGEQDAWDIATAHVLSMSAIGERTPVDVEPIPALTEVLDHGQEGQPRWVVLDARRGRGAADTLERAADDAAARGYVPVAVELYLQYAGGMLADVLSDRTLMLIASPSTPVTAARSALVRAAEQNPRPHVLVSLRMQRAAPTPDARTAAVVVREARAAYGVARVPRGHAAVTSPDVARHLARASRAAVFLRAGSHAAAERLLRDVAGALRRRDAPGAEARVLLRLGAMLLDRARVGDADVVWGDAATAAERAGEPTLYADARIGQAWARVEARQLTAAESICRALLVTGTVGPIQRVITAATLARVLVAQGRLEEAAALDLDWPASAPCSAWAAMADDQAVRVLMATGRLFEAGRRARDLLARCAEERAADDEFAWTGGQESARAVAQSAHLRVMASTGDMSLARQAFLDAVTAARRARAPLHLVEAHLIWMDAASRAGMTRDACSAARVLRRMRRGVPPLLRDAIDRRLGTERAPAVSACVLPPSDPARALIALSHERDDDRDAVTAMLEWTATRVHAGRIDVWSCDAGPASVVLTVGGGAPTVLGSRVLDAGIAIGPEPSAMTELGAPVRLGPALVGAVAARWTVDRPIPSHARELIELAAAVAAPRIDRMKALAREAAKPDTIIPELVGVSEAMSTVRKAVARAAAAPFAVLIEGESGVGKELVARAIHHLSPRRERRCCDVNCAALPDDLLDAELFGHARGAFTGALVDRAGLFEEADGGTLFLDELADLSPRAQAKLLRVIQEQEVRRVGESFGRKVDVRIVTAANRDMRVEAAEGRFRQDLLYRLDVIRIRIPPLRERPGDIPVLAAHFWSAAAARVGSTATLTHGVLAALSTYGWPGNVRELQNAIAALAVAAPSRGRVPASLLPPAIAGSALGVSARLADARAQFERRFIEGALARAGGRRSRAARDLGVSRQGLLKLITRLGITSAGG